jgi:hypothetical protein
MKIKIILALGLVCSLSLHAQSRGRAQPPGLAAPATPATGDYGTDLDVVVDAQGQALDQAKQMLESADEGDHTALQTVIKEMERSRAALEAAKKTPEKLAEAVAAEQSAYQALLKAMPREFRVARSRSGQRGQRGGGNQSGQPGEDELSQLDLTDEQNRYETERQAAPAPTQQQTEQAQTADRLKQLARRQQDLNERLRDLQNALQAARTDQEREEAQRQLKRLRAEERQMLADTDELRQQMEQSPNAGQQAQARQQLDQTRNDVQKAAEQMDKQAVSEALASGSRAEENLQNLRDNLRQQSSSRFTQQMRQIQNEARDLASQEEQVARDLNNLNDSNQKPLDDSAQRRPIEQQLTNQEAALTNLVAQMRTLTEQAETTEPLLAQQLYDIIRREDQKHTDSQLDLGAQLVDRGFLPQAAQAETVARTNINELRQNVDKAAESVLGSEADALRFAQKELDDLANQLAREAGGGTNTPGTNSAAQGRRGSRSGAGAGNGESETNAIASAQGGEPQAGDGQNSPNGEREGQANPGNRGGGRQGQGRGQGQRQGNSETAQNGGGGQQPGENGAGAQPGDQNNPDGQQPSGRNGRGGRGGQRGGQNGNGGEQANADGGRGDVEQLRQIARQIGGSNGGAGGAGGLNRGPITGNNFVDWSGRLRDVAQALDAPDLRNQLDTVRERVAVYRREFRDSGRIPSKEELQARAIEPLTLAREWVAQELSRAQKDRSLVPLDRDPVQDQYSDAVRKYYEKLGSPQ